jgi:hypothetical protein
VICRALDTSCTASGGTAWLLVPQRASPSLNGNVQAQGLSLTVVTELRGRVRIAHRSRVLLGARASRPLSSAKPTFDVLFSDLSHGDRPKSGELFPRIGPVTRSQAVFQLGNGLGYAAKTIPEIKIRREEFRPFSVRSTGQEALPRRIQARGMRIPTPSTTCSDTPRPVIPTSFDHLLSGPLGFSSSWRRAGAVRAGEARVFEGFAAEGEP